MIVATLEKLVQRRVRTAGRRVAPVLSAGVTVVAQDGIAALGLEHTPAVVAEVVRAPVTVVAILRRFTGQHVHRGQHPDLPRHRRRSDRLIHVAGREKNGKQDQREQTEHGGFPPAYNAKIASCEQNT